VFDIDPDPCWLLPAHTNGACGINDFKPMVNCVPEKTNVSAVIITSGVGLRVTVSSGITLIKVRHESTMTGGGTVRVVFTVSSSLMMTIQ